MKNILLFAVMTACLQACFGSCQPPCKPSIPYPQPGSCGQAGVPAGKTGGKCLQGAPACPEAWDECISGTCLPCGDPDGRCCTYVEACKGSGVCQSVGLTCKTDCGHAGQPCCSGNQCVEGGQACNANSKFCESTSSQCNVGSNTYLIPIIDSVTRCGDAYPINANTLADAVSCVQAIGQSNGFEIAPNGAVLKEDYAFCNTSEFPPPKSLQVPAYSEADAYTCAHNDCSNCETVKGPCE